MAISGSIIGQYSMSGSGISGASGNQMSTGTRSSRMEFRLNRSRNSIMRENDDKRQCASWQTSSNRGENAIALISVACSSSWRDRRHDDSWHRLAIFAISRPASMAFAPLSLDPIAAIRPKWRAGAALQLSTRREICVGWR